MSIQWMMPSNKIILKLRFRFSIKAIQQLSFIFKSSEIFISKVHKLSQSFEKLNWIGLNWSRNRPKTFFLLHQKVSHSLSLSLSSLSINLSIYLFYLLNFLELILANLNSTSVLASNKWLEARKRIFLIFFFCWNEIFKIPEQSTSKKTVTRDQS